MTGYLVCFLFVFTCIICYIEDYLGKFKLPIYIGIGASLILVAALRVIGDDPDSDNYEETFLSIAAGNEPDVIIESSFVYISQFISNFTSDVHFLFFFYALFGVSLKFIAFRQLCDSWFLPVLVYIGYFFIFHECMQMRSGVLSAMLLLSVRPWCEGNRLKAFFFLAIGFFFHHSAIMLLPLLFLSNKPISDKGRIVWASLIPLAYIFYFFGFSALLNVSVDLPYIGDKLALYQLGTEKGRIALAVNVFNPLHLFTTFLYFYILYFQETLIEKNKYYPLLVKLLGIGIFSYTAFGAFPAIAQRIDLLLRIVSIILYANVCYTIRPRWAAVTVVMLISFAYLNIAAPSISLHLLWAGS